MRLRESLALATLETFGYKETSFFPELGIETGVDSDEALFRKLSQTSAKDLPEYKHERIQQIAFYLYTSNPLAKRLTDLTKDFVIGKGITFEADDERVQEILNDH